MLKSPIDNKYVIEKQNTSQCFDYRSEGESPESLAHAWLVQMSRPF